MAEGLFSLPPSQRLARYRELADEARRFAQHVGPLGTRESYLRIAEHWKTLADELEATMAKSTS